MWQAHIGTTGFAFVLGDLCWSSASRCGLARGVSRYQHVLALILIDWLIISPKPSANWAVLTTTYHSLNNTEFHTMIQQHTAAMHECNMVGFPYVLSCRHDLNIHTTNLRLWMKVSELRAQTTSTYCVNKYSYLPLSTIIKHDLLAKWVVILIALLF